MSELIFSDDTITELAEAVLNEGNHLQFRASGRSMFPFIRGGDILEIAPVSGYSPRLTDVVLYKGTNNRIQVHRIVGLNQETDRTKYLLQGDSLIQRDSPVLREHVLGRVVALKRNGRMVRIDSPAQYFLARLWVGILPFRHILFKILASVKSLLTHLIPDLVSSIRL